MTTASTSVCYGLLVEDKAYNHVSPFVCFVLFESSKCFKVLPIQQQLGQELWCECEPKGYIRIYINSLNKINVDDWCGWGCDVMWCSMKSNSLKPEGNGPLKYFSVKSQ